MSDISRARQVGWWFVATVGAFACSIAGGEPMTLNAVELWVVAALVPPTVMFLVWQKAPAVTVTDVLYAANHSRKRRQAMSPRKTLVAAVVGLVLAAGPLYAQEVSGYRGFQLGAGLPSVLALTQVAASKAKTIHQRPALMQQLEWRLPRYGVGAIPLTDPVREIVFSFYDDQLFRMVVDYDPDRTAGLTDGDVIDGLSVVYGVASKPLKRLPAAGSQVESESGTPVARWGDTESSIVLYRSADLYLASASRFRVIVASPRLETLARTADAQAVRLDATEAPIIETARQKKEVADTRAIQEKARVTNKAAFKP